MALSKTTSSSNHHQKLTTFAFLVVLAHMLLWVSPGIAAMYRCHDHAGTQVLTDNPAQLKSCSQLKSSIVSTPQLPQKASTLPEEQDISRNELPKQFSQQSDASINKEFSHHTKNDHDVTIPLKKIGGSFVAQVNLNKERTAHLIVDTGASMTVLSTNIAIDLGILGTTDNELLTVNTAGGSVQVNTNYLSSLAVGDARAHHVAVAIHDLPDIPEQIEGLLGMSFLKHFLITLDAENARLILRPKPSS